MLGPRHSSPSGRPRIRSWGPGLGWGYGWRSSACRGDTPAEDSAPSSCAPDTAGRNYGCRAGARGRCRCHSTQGTRGPPPRGRQHTLFLLLFLLLLTPLETDTNTGAEEKNVQYISCQKRSRWVNKMLVMLKWRTLQREFKTVVVRVKRG